jgi:hypothetical protein
MGGGMHGILVDVQGLAVVAAVSLVEAVEAGVDGVAGAGVLDGGHHILVDLRGDSAGFATQQAAVGVLAACVRRRIWHRGREGGREAGQQQAGGGCRQVVVSGRGWAGATTQGCPDSQEGMVLGVMVLGVMVVVVVVVVVAA